MAGLFDPNPDYDIRETTDLISLAFDETASPGHRLAAVTNLGRRGRDDPSLVQMLSTIANSQEMQSVRFLHGPSLAYVAIAGLVNRGTPEAKDSARKAINSFSNYDREDVTWFLKAGGFTL